MGTNEPTWVLNRLYNMDYLEGRVVNEYLVMRCQTGDREALGIFVKKWQPPFLKYATVITKDADLAADIMQDAWMKIIKGLPKLRDPMKFPAWAFRIINNQSMDALRKRRRQAETTSESVSKPMHNLEVKEQVWWILDQLSPQHRSVLALHYLQGFEVADIAKIVGKPKGTVKSRLFNAREKFKSILEAQNTSGAKTSSTGDSHERSGRKNSGCTHGRYQTACTHC